MIILDKTTVNIKGEYFIAMIGQAWKHIEGDILYVISNISFHKGDVFFFLIESETNIKCAVDIETFETSFSFNGDVFDPIKNDIEYTVSLWREKLEKNQCKIKKLNEKITTLENYEEYSYYVGGEITADRMPLKYSPWLDERKKGNL